MCALTKSQVAGCRPLHRQQPAKKLDTIAILFPHGYCTNTIRQSRFSFLGPASASSSMVLGKIDTGMVPLGFSRHHDREAVVISGSPGKNSAHGETRSGVPRFNMDIQFIIAAVSYQPRGGQHRIDCFPFGPEL